MSEVERFDAYYGYPSCRATGRHIHANGEFVLASDYDALAAELAHLKMKVENAEKVGVTWTHIYDGEEACGYPGAEEHGEQLSALRSELARVKAESLRVVKVGDECEISRIPICGLFSYLGVVYCLYSFSPDEFGAWQVSDHSEHIFAPHTFVQPVHLVPIAELEAEG